MPYNPQMHVIQWTKALLFGLQQTERWQATGLRGELLENATRRRRALQTLLEETETPGPTPGTETARQQIRERTVLEVKQLAELLRSDHMRTTALARVEAESPDEENPPATRGIALMALKVTPVGARVEQVAPELSNVEPYTVAETGTGHRVAILPGTVARWCREREHLKITSGAWLVRGDTRAVVETAITLWNDDRHQDLSAALEAARNIHQS